MKRNSTFYLISVCVVFAGGTLYAMEQHSHSHPHPGPVAAERHDIGTEIIDRLEIGLLVEVEGYASRIGSVNESDIVLATVEFLADAEVAENISAHLGLLWEEDDTEENILDEGYITFGSVETTSFYARAGKMYLPFGDFTSCFISDPLTLELAEINQSAAMAGYGNSWLDLNAGAFNGDFEADTEENTIDDLFASVSFTPCEGVVFGACLLSDLLETDGFEDFVSGAFPGGAGYKDILAAGAYLNAQVGLVSLSLEYVEALEEMNPPSGGLRPRAYNAEASMPVHEKVAVGVKLEGSDDFYSDFNVSPAGKWPDWQAGAVVSYALNRHVVVSGEFLHSEGLDGDEEGDTATMQVAFVL